MAKATGARPAQQLHSIRDHIYGNQQHQPKPWTLADTAAADYMRSTDYDPCGDYGEPVWIRPSAIVETKRPVEGYCWRGVEGGMTLKDTGGMEYEG